MVTATAAPEHGVAQQGGDSGLIAKLLQLDRDQQAAERMSERLSGSKQRGLGLAHEASRPALLRSHA